MSDVNINNKTISVVIQQVYPDEVFLLGPAILDDLLSGYTEYKKAKEGSHLDQSAVVNLIASSIALLTAGIELYKTLYKDLKRKPSSDELKESLKIQSTNTYKKIIGDEQTEILINNLLIELDKYKDNENE